METENVLNPEMQTTFMYIYSILDIPRPGKIFRFNLS